MKIITPFSNIIDLYHSVIIPDAPLRRVVAGASGPVSTAKARGRGKYFPLCAYIYMGIVLSKWGLWEKFFISGGFVSNIINDDFCIFLGIL